MPDLTADPALAEAELGFTAPRDLEIMCRDLWNWQTKNPLGYDTPQENEPTTTTEEAEAPAPKVETASEPAAAAPAVATTPKGSPKSKAKKNGNKSGEQDQVAESD